MAIDAEKKNIQLLPTFIVNITKCRLVLLHSICLKTPVLRSFRHDKIHFFFLLIYILSYFPRSLSTGHYYRYLCHYVGLWEMRTARRKQ